MYDEQIKRIVEVQKTLEQKKAAREEELRKQQQKSGPQGPKGPLGMTTLGPDRRLSRKSKNLNIEQRLTERRFSNLNFV